MTEQELEKERKRKEKRIFSIGDQEKRAGYDMHGNDLECQKEPRWNLFCQTAHA